MGKGRPGEQLPWAREGARPSGPGPALGLLPPLPVTQCPPEQPLPRAGSKTPFNPHPALSQQGLIQPPGEQGWEPGRTVCKSVNCASLQGHGEAIPGKRNRDRQRTGRGGQPHWQSRASKPDPPDGRGLPATPCPPSPQGHMGCCPSEGAGQRPTGRERPFPPDSGNADREPADGGRDGWRRAVPTGCRQQAELADVCPRE